MPSSLRSALNSYQIKLDALQPDIDRLKQLRGQLRQLKPIGANQLRRKTKKEICEIENTIKPKIRQSLEIIIRNPASFDVDE